MDETYSKREGQLPLSGITVIEMTQVVAGPFATMTLADLGAEIIKIEAVGRGDRARNIRPSPAYFDSVNRNKQSVAINVKTEAGQEAVKTLVRDADVFIESNKPGRTEKYNLSYQDLSQVNPELIYCSISGFGRNSPYENVPAWDMIIQAMSGVMSMTGAENGPPMWSGLPSGDIAASMYATQSILAALYAQSLGHIDGDWIEVPMLDAAISWLCSRAGYTFANDEPFPRLGTRHPSIAPFGLYDCADGTIAIAAGTPSLWTDFCKVIDAEDLLEDERFATADLRVENVDALTERIETELADGTVSEWTGRLHGASIPAGPLNDTQTIWDDEHVQQRELRQTLKRSDRVDAEVIDHPVHFANIATHLGDAPEQLGESTETILERHGYTDSEIDRLREENVIE